MKNRSDKWKGNTKFYLQISTMRQREPRWNKIQTSMHLIFCFSENKQRPLFFFRTHVAHGYSWSCVVSQNKVPKKKRLRKCVTIFFFSLFSLISSAFKKIIKHWRNEKRFTKIKKKKEEEMKEECNQMIYLA